MNPSQASAKQHPPLRFYQRLHFRIVLLYLLVTAVIMAATLLAFKLYDRQIMLRHGYHKIGEIGSHITARLGERIILVEGLTGTIANLGESLEPDPAQFKQIVPHLLDYESNAEFIAGGGIWPEPYAFDPSKERSSFFWGRDDFGVLQYYDDYNDPNGPGYHQEEWYVPAKFVPPGRAFWSKSYMDPYSHQPMVTCTIAMHKAGNFRGVATCDLRLEGLDSFLKQSASAVGGYVFALDRNHKFLSYPRPHMIRRETVQTTGTRTLELFYLSELAAAYPAYDTAVQALTKLDEELMSLALHSGHFRTELVDEIAGGSYQINKQEARRIVASLNQGDEVGTIKHLTWANDPILGGPVIAAVVHMPRTHWDLVVVAPSSWVYDAGEATSPWVILLVLALEFAGLLALYPILRTHVAKPLRRMTASLREAGKAAESAPRLDDSARNELGLLAEALNRRFGQISHAFTESARERCAQTENTFRSLLDQLPWPAALVGEDNSFAYQNSPFSHCFAQPSTQAKLFSAIFESDKEPTLGHRLVHLELDGDIYPFHTLCLTVSQDPEPPLIAVIAIDIGDQLEAELIRRERAAPPPP